MQPCACVEPDHERASCPHRATVAMRAVLYAGLFDGSGVRLLNPAYTGDDGTCRRFALLEIE
jgi:hypothetical protein